MFGFLHAYSIVDPRSPLVSPLGRKSPAVRRARPAPTVRACARTPVPHARGLALLARGGAAVPHRMGMACLCSAAGHSSGEKRIIIHTVYIILNSHSMTCAQHTALRQCA